MASLQFQGFCPNSKGFIFHPEMAFGPLSSMVAQQRLWGFCTCSHPRDIPTESLLSQAHQSSCSCFSIIFNPQPLKNGPKDDFWSLSPNPRVTGRKGKKMNPLVWVTKVIPLPWVSLPAPETIPSGVTNPSPACSGQALRAFLSISNKKGQAQRAGGWKKLKIPGKARVDPSRASLVTERGSCWWHSSAI